MDQTNLDLGNLQETKLMGGVYTRRSARYSVVAMEAPIQHRGRVAVFYRASPSFSVEALHQFVPKSVRLQMDTGQRIWYIVG